MHHAVHFTNGLTMYKPHAHVACGTCNHHMHSIANKAVCTATQAVACGLQGRRALDFVLKNQGLIDKTLLFDIELMRINQ